MKRSHLMGILCACMLMGSGMAQAIHIGGSTEDKLNVPEDFPDSFQMDLLGGFAAWDLDPAYGTPQAFGAITLDTTERNIPFSATAFDGIGPGEGTSTLTLSPIDHWVIGTSEFFGLPMTFFIDGAGSGTLEDSAGSTEGHWTLDLPFFMFWNGLTIPVPNFSLSSAATYNYEGLSGPSSISGTVMDYHTGDTFLVGQSTITDASTGFAGVRLTFGFSANDPLAVPLPASVWLFSSGLLGLIGISRRKKAA